MTALNFFREIGKLQQSAPIKSVSETVGTFIRNTGRYAAAPIGLGLGAGVGMWGVSEGISASADNIITTQAKEDNYNQSKDNGINTLGALKLILTALFIIFLYKRMFQK